MSTKVLIEVDAQHEAIVRRALAMAEEMEQLALTAPEGAVFDACENAVIQKGRQLQSQMLGDAVARRIEAAEKKGRRCDSAPAVGPKRIAGPRRANS
jgi:formylmethanofuran:tetrahydromethanopterin formyltransferase